MKIYITHCTSKKDNRYKETNEEITPDTLYVGKKIQRFINNCRNKNVNWAIFSDHYGIWYPYEKHKWYEKPPDNVTDSEFEQLVKSSKEKLKNYDKVYFYRHSCRFHPLYRKLVKRLYDEGINIELISKFQEIESA
ncbi:MAG: hypothetical protein V1718_05700 [archaeon]